jgi:FkbM family methyltransferase
MKVQVVDFVSRNLRWLVYSKRYLKALIDSRLPIKASYAQHGEDCEIVKLLSGLNLQAGIYIDVGANQPSYISNTYLFYKQGLKGILIEPDASNARLLKHFRSSDIIIQSLAGQFSALRKFNYSVSSVRNSVQDIPASMLLESAYLPQLSIDDIVDSIQPEWIYLLSTDTEGNDLNVLKGASEALKKIFLVCSEYNDDQEMSELTQYMYEHSFELVFSNHVNAIFRNTVLSEKLPLKNFLA